ncbi:MAG TPA: hypothetical protein VE197_16180 [Mycobacterium sp.]|nr:hypothetical protein [Mycobacterium sp.]
MNTEFVDRHLVAGRLASRQAMQRSSARHALRQAQLRGLDAIGMVTQ